MEDKQPYEELGGLEDSLRKKKEANAQQTTAALEGWRKNLAEQSNARVAIAQQAKPVDTKNEQRRLNNLAKGQAFGELMGALFGGIIGLRKGGGGYAPKMPGMYNKTFAKLEHLKAQGVQADKEYKGLMANLSLQDIASQGDYAKAQYNQAIKQGQYLEDQSRDIDRIKMQGAQRQELEQGRSAARDAFEKEQFARRGKLQAQGYASRAELQRNRHEERLEEHRSISTAKPGTPEYDQANGITDAVKEIKMLLLPKQTTTRNQGGKFETTTTRDRTSYSKQEDDAATAEAKQIAPVKKQFRLSDTEVMSLRAVMSSRTDVDVTWEDVGEALDSGILFEEVVELLKHK